MLTMMGAGAERSAGEVELDYGFAFGLVDDRTIVIRLVCDSFVLTSRGSV